MRRQKAHLYQLWYPKPLDFGLLNARPMKFYYDAVGMSPREARFESHGADQVKVKPVTRYWPKATAVWVFACISLNTAQWDP